MNRTEVLGDLIAWEDGVYGGLTAISSSCPSRTVATISICLAIGRMGLRRYSATAHDHWGKQRCIENGMHRGTTFSTQTPEALNRSVSDTCVKTVTCV